MKVKEAKIRLGTLFNDDDYPPLDRVAERFGFALDILPIPMGSDFRCDIGDDEAEKIKADIEKATLATVQSAIADVYKRVAGVPAADAGAVDADAAGQAGGGQVSEHQPLGGGRTADVAETDEQDGAHAAVFAEARLAVKPAATVGVSAPSRQGRSRLVSRGRRPGQEDAVDTGHAAGHQPVDEAADEAGGDENGDLARLAVQ